MVSYRVVCMAYLSCSMALSIGLCTLQGLKQGV